jgi:hypothetical protein
MKVLRNCSNGNKDEGKKIDTEQAYFKSNSWFLQLMEKREQSG